MIKVEENKKYMGVYVDEESNELLNGKIIVGYASRSVAMMSLVYAEKDGEIYFFVQQRGPKCPDHVGKWAFSSGYLSWHETRKQGAIRELYEETGLKIPENIVQEWKTIDDPEKDARENIVTRYIIKLDYDTLKEDLQNGTINWQKAAERGGKDGEVSGLMLVSREEIKNYELAFNHDQVIEEFIKEFIDVH